MTAQADNGPGSDSGHDMTDLELMLLIRDGDESALETLMARYWKPLVRYAVRMVRSVDTAEDIVQHTFVTVWRNRASWKPVGTPQGFLYRIVRNRALEKLRARETRERSEPEIARRHPAVPTPLEVTEGEELEHALQDALDALPERRREAFVLSRYHGLSLAEVGEIMGISSQTVANHVSMALAELRRSLARFLW